MTESKLIKSLHPVIKKSDNFDHYLSPVVKEFDRFADKAIEEGVPITFAEAKHIRIGRPTEVKDFMSQTGYYRNCYYAVIRTIFNNLSHEDHSRFGERFKIHPGRNQRDLIAVANPNSTFSGSTRPNGRMLNFHIKSKDKTKRSEILRVAYEKYGKDDSYELNVDIELAIAVFPDEEKTRYQELKEKYDRTKEKVDALFPTFDAAIKPLIRTKHEKDLGPLDKLTLISQLATPRNKNAPQTDQKQQKKASQFLKLHRCLTQRWIDLQDYVRSLLPTYKLMIDERVAMPLRAQYLPIYAMKKKKHVRAWKIQKDTTVELVKDWKHGDELIDLLLVPDDVLFLKEPKNAEWDEKDQDLFVDQDGEDDEHNLEPSVGKQRKIQSNGKTKSADKKKNSGSKQNNNDEEF